MTAVIPMSTQEWQRAKLGPSFKRDLKWWTVAFQASGQAMRDQIVPVMLAATETFLNLVETLTLLPPDRLQREAEWRLLARYGSHPAGSGIDRLRIAPPPWWNGS